ncbi:S8 family serine peptidase [Saccharopolyspora halophila]
MIDSFDGHERPSAPTGRYVVVLSDQVQGDRTASDDVLRSVAGSSNIASTNDFSEGALDLGQTASADATMFAELGVGVISADPERVASIIAAAGEDSRVLAVEPERTMHALASPQSLSAEYLRGFRDAAVNLHEHVNGAATRAPEFVDTPELTWGLQATGVAQSQQSGSGVPITVLDTGFDLRHPDFGNRQVNARSFIPGETAQDGNGHGTHCTGTSAGPADPPAPPGSRRYGAAHAADIQIGKVLSDQGSGTDSNILAGINWAIASGSRVISMSLGANIREVSQRYEQVGRRALERGSLIVAAAGNNADRANGNPGFVGIPANSRSIMAVGAVDNQLRIANFSARSNPVQGGQVDIAAPGVDIYSSWPMDQRYNTISGTSMATPHVAGIAALWSQQSGATGTSLWALLMRTAQRLELPSLDAGAGLAQAPR